LIVRICKVTAQNGLVQLVLPLAKGMQDLRCAGQGFDVVWAQISYDVMQRVIGQLRQLPHRALYTSCVILLFWIVSRMAKQRKMSQPTFSLVVSAYQESLDWIRDVRPMLSRVYIYDKNDDARHQMAGAAARTLYPDDTTVLPNVGRESHSYLHHIVTHYDDLTDYVIFTQADPEIVRGPKTRWIDAWKAELVRYGFTQNAVIAEQFGTHYEWTLQSWRDRPLAQDGRTFGAWFQEYVRPVREEEECFPRPVRWFIKAVFGLSKERIRARPKAVYERLLRDTLLSKENSPVDAHYIERAWFYVFDLDRPLPTSVSENAKTLL
jgi:hypothetical protein